MSKDNDTPIQDSENPIPEIDDVEISDDWSDSSSDESYGKVLLTERSFFDVYGGHKNDKFYIPPSHHRATMSEGNHVIPSVFVRFIISALEGENIKTLPGTFYKIAKSILPEKDEEIKAITQDLTKKISDSRRIRKKVTAKLGSPQDRSQDIQGQKQFIQNIKDRFIEADKYDIHREIEGVASKFISLFDSENSFPEERKTASGSQGESECLGRLLTLEEFLYYQGAIDKAFLDATNSQTTTSRGSQLRLFTDYTGDYRPSSAKNAKDLLPKLTQLKSPGNRINMIKGIASCMCQPFDYSRTEKQDEFFESTGILIRYDDEAVLYKSTARLMVITFTAFKDIFLQLSSAEKGQLYEEVLKIILNKKWRVETISIEDSGEQKSDFIKSHYVIAPDGLEKPIDKSLLKIGVEKFAIINFEAGLKMKDPNDPDPAQQPPVNFSYCNEQRRPKKVIKDPTTEISTPQKPIKSKKLPSPAKIETDSSSDDNKTLAAKPSSNPAPEKKKTKGAKRGGISQNPSE